MKTKRGPTRGPWANHALSLPRRMTKAKNGTMDRTSRDATQGIIHQVVLQDRVELR